MERNEKESEINAIETHGRASQLFIGIDIGTQGARVVLIDGAGNVIASAEESFPLTDLSRQEQSPEMWWNSCLSSLNKMLSEARNNIDVNGIKALAVTSTSGTVIPLDKENHPLHPAIMYSDQRSANVSERCKEAALKAHLPEGAYTNFNFSSGLCKMVWFVGTFPDKVNKIAKFIHAADYITGKLCGRFDVTDYTNALKSGYDIQNLTWPSYLYNSLPIKKEWLQEVHSSGTPVGQLLPYIKKELHLNHDVRVVTGVTDGCASQIASGAAKPGEWNTTIGTTLVIKGVTQKPVIDPLGRLYNHRHPDGYFMPGGASNTGADWITEKFSNRLEKLNDKAMQLIPTGYLSWPLYRKGERFPFIAPDAKGFEPEGLITEELYTANMEGVAYIERYAYEMIENLSGEKVTAVYTAGGGSNSNTWLKIRSNVLNLPVYKMKSVTGAVGAAILAASKTYFSSLSESAGTLTQIEKIIYPEKELTDQYAQNYRRFVSELVQKGYIKQ